jgi:hypothetical protein
MYEIIDGFISIAGGSYVYLAATGRVLLSKSEEKSEEGRNKFGSAMKILGQLVIAFGVFRRSSPFLGLS